MFEGYGGMSRIGGGTQHPFQNNTVVPMWPSALASELLLRFVEVSLLPASMK